MAFLKAYMISVNDLRGLFEDLYGNYCQKKTTASFLTCCVLCQMCQIPYCTAHVQLSTQMRGK